MLQSLFHSWERRLAAATTDRVVRPFDWGLDWIPENGHHTTAAPADRLGHWISEVMVDSDAFFTPPPTTDYTLTSNWGLPSEAHSAKEGDLLTFPSAFTTPHHENNTVYARYFPARLKPSRSGSTADRNAKASAERRGAAAGPAAVLVLPQWNSTADGHIGLSKLLAWSGMSALRLSLPYHDWRMPPELHRADYIVSANVARTVQVCRQSCAGRAARDRVAGGTWLRADRDSGQQPGIVSCAVDDGARAADSRGSAEPHLAAFRGRGVARVVDASRARRTRRPHRARSASNIVAADQPALVSRDACAIARRCSFTRDTT